MIRNRIEVLVVLAHIDSLLHLAKWTFSLIALISSIVSSSAKYSASPRHPSNKAVPKQSFLQGRMSLEKSLQNTYRNFTYWHNFSTSGYCLYRSAEADVFVPKTFSCLYIFVPSNFVPGHFRAQTFSCPYDIFVPMTFSCEDIFVPKVHFRGHLYIFIPKTFSCPGFLAFKTHDIFVPRTFSCLTFSCLDIFVPIWHFRAQDVFVPRHFRAQETFACP